MTDAKRDGGMTRSMMAISDEEGARIGHAIAAAMNMEDGK